MHILLNKIQSFCLRLSSLFLDNGAGRAVKIEQSSEVGDPSGFSMFISQILKTIGNALLDFGEFLLRCLARIAYFIIKIVLNLMDFMNVIIKQLSGQAVNYSVGENANLAESDILFKFLFNEFVLKILKAVFIFSILLLIIFTIMAIVKQEWENHVTGKQNNIKKIFRKVLISIFSMIVVPFILIVGIVFSNVILASAMSALSKNQGTYSLGAQIFSASSYEGNMYRVYASNGKKIPIVFDYDGGFEKAKPTQTPSYPETSTSAQEKVLYNIKTNGNFSTGQSTYNMFKDENFYEFNTISDASVYYDMYDGPYLKTKQIEYYVMADFLDFALSSGGVFYIRNTEDVYMSVLNYISAYGFPEVPAIEDKNEDDAIKQKRQNIKYIYEVLNTLTPYDINNEKLLTSSVQDDIKAFADNVVNNNTLIDHINFSVYYNKDRANVLLTEGLTNEGLIEYSSLVGSTDEVSGAKYLFCHKVILNEYGDYLYIPVQLGDQINGNKYNSSFLSKAPLTQDGKSTLREETLFLARGVFTSAGYPTAIREEGKTIAFYRHDPSSPSSVNYSEIFNYQTMNGQENSDDSTSFGDIFEFVTGVDVTTLVPDIQINLNFLRVFTKEEVNESNLESGKFMVNYSFVGSNLKLQHLYDELKINYLVLIFACVSLFMSLFYIIWGLIQRLYEITLLWITMPGWIAKFPIEKGDQIGSGTAFAGWKDRMIERIMALYSVYLSLALILLLIPVVFEMDYITAFNIPDTNIFGIFNADIANLVIKTAFVLVLFKFLDVRDTGDSNKNVARLIEDFVLMNKADPRKGYLAQTGANVIKDIKEVGSKAYGLFTPTGMLKTVKGAALKVAHGTANSIPGKIIFDKIRDHGAGQKKFEQRNDAMLANAQNEFLAKTSEDDIKEGTDKLNSATSDHNYMEGYRQAVRDNRRGTGKGTKGDFRAGARSSDKGMAKRLGKVAKEDGGVKIKVGKKKMKERKANRQTRRERGV